MRTRSVLSILSLAAVTASQTAFADNIAYSLNKVGLIGGIYVGAGSLEKESLSISNSAGVLVGSSTIYNGGSTSVGSADWYYNPVDQSTTQIGLTGANGSVYLNSNGFVNTGSVSTLFGVSATGYTAGTSSRYGASNVSLGSDAWVYSPGTGTVALPLPTALATDPVGTSYTKTIAAGTFDGFSSVTGATNSGAVVGSINRYDASGNSLGSDAFYYNPSTGNTTIISLLNANNASPSTGARSPLIGGIGVNGQVIGTQSHYLSNGGLTSSDVFYYSPATGTIKINLTDTAASNPSGVGHVTSTGSQSNNDYTRINALGQAVGFSSRYNLSDGYIGQDVFFYDPVTTDAHPGEITLGLTGTGYIFSNGTQSNYYNTAGLNVTSDGGQVVGYANRVDTTGTTALGQDTWEYDSKLGTTVAIALSGGVYSNSTITAGDSHSSKPIIVSNAGQVGGIASRYTATGAFYGQDSWYYDPAHYNGNVTIQTPTQVGLTGGVYAETFGTVGLQNSNITAINATGEVAGYSTRYLANVTNGQEAWVAVNGVTVDVTASVTPTDTTQPFYSTITALNDNGVAVGYYAFSNSPSITGETAFAWSPATGFVNLGLAVSPNTTLAQWQELASAQKITAAGTIFGYGQLTGDASTSQTVFRLNQLAVGDANGDGVVDLSDLNIVLNNLGSTTSLWANGNFDGAATIDLTDLNDVLNNLGVHTAPGAIAAAPEPASLSLLALSGILLTRRRNTKR